MHILLNWWECKCACWIIDGITASHMPSPSMTTMVMGMAMKRNIEISTNIILFDCLMDFARAFEKFSRASLAPLATSARATEKPYRIMCHIQHCCLSSSGCTEYFTLEWKSFSWQIKILAFMSLTRKVEFMSLMPKEVTSQPTPLCFDISAEHEHNLLSAQLCEQWT